MQIDHDRLYKELIRNFFREFIELFFPKLAQWLDFTHVHFLSEEIVTDVTGGSKSRVDLLIETKLKGDDAILLIHIEPQAYQEKHFNERMFLYTGRLFEKYRRIIVPIAVFSHKSKQQEPDRLEWKLPFLHVLQFNFFKLQLVHEDWRKFARMDNPVAAALLSSMGYSRNDQIELQISFLRILFNLRLDPAKMELITVFFETYAQIDKADQLTAFDEYRKQYPQEEAQFMKWMTSFERVGYEKGKIEGFEKGLHEGMATVAAKLIANGLSNAAITEITGLSDAEIDKLRTMHKGG